MQNEAGMASHRCGRPPGPSDDQTGSEQAWGVQGWEPGGGGAGLCAWHGMQTTLSYYLQSSDGGTTNPDLCMGKVGLRPFTKLV